MRIGDGGDERADIDAAIGERQQYGAQQVGRQGGEIALQIDHHIMAAIGVQLVEGELHPVGA